MLSDQTQPLPDASAVSEGSSATPSSLGRQRMAGGPFGINL
ncbi:hypothetical protein HNR42_003211 [Deinobacterium chartae]|uniref:Uncharacterized protein n=1 Tax=Deinobacterium chartae TaxID=521158 RepID=A0A841I383_9DEIO|nr:hypothetical protein [Deinobacterium chartae]